MCKESAVKRRTYLNVIIEQLVVRLAAFFLVINKNNIDMKHIQKYSGKRMADGSDVRGYEAIGSESERDVILGPAKGTDDKFHIIEVQHESLVPVL